MLTKRILPCLDVRNGVVVKGVRFRSLTVVGDPAELAVSYERTGADEIVFLDIAATAEGRGPLLDAVRRTAERLFIPLTVGGGIRTYEDVREMLRSGADKVSINTAAVERPELIAECARDFGVQCVVVAIDSKAGRVYVRGGTQPTEIDAVSWARRAAQLGAGEILLTSIDADGTRDGYDLDLTRRVSEAVPVPVIASGGCGSPDHIVDVLTRGGADAALAASIFHYGEWTPAQVKDRMRTAGLPAR